MLASPSRDVNSGQVKAKKGRLLANPFFVLNSPRTRKTQSVVSKKDEGEQATYAVRPLSINWTLIIG